MVTKKAITTQVIFFIAMSLIMIWIIIFGLQKINTVSSTISQQEEIEIRAELEDAFLFCSDPINSGSLKRIDLSGRPYNSICYNCQLGDETIISQELKDEATILSQAGSNFLLLETSVSSNNIQEYNIVGQLQIEELGYSNHIVWLDLDNSEDLEIEIKCE
jgi:hypothetical protein